MYTFYMADRFCGSSEGGAGVGEVKHVNGWEPARCNEAHRGLHGMGLSGPYPPEVAAMYEKIETTPDNLLLWFHPVNYIQKLKSGKTQSLKEKIDDEHFEDVLFRQVFYAGYSIVWRDAIVNFYNNISGIPDDAGRIEAESMELSGYQPYVVSPFEAASNSIAIVTSTNSTMGTATKVLNFTSGVYDLAVSYFDMYGGNSSYQVFVNNRMVGEWVGNIVDIGKLGHTPSIYLDGHSATGSRSTSASDETVHLVQQ
ncbi:glycoside hydrolase superfamily [Mycena leptocephala]|nr:glycoside hydrolase superfamily [Mycena leptocephala]